MRKIIVFNWVSIDNFIAGPGGETEWFVWDKEIEEYYKHVQNSVDTIIYGRKTYETMSAYWPTAAALQEDPAIREHMNNTHKIVYSKSVKKTEWNNSHIANEIITHEVNEMKEREGKNIVIYGSGSIISVFANLNLIDEYLIMINPIIYRFRYSIISRDFKATQIRYVGC